MHIARKWHILRMNKRDTYVKGTLKNYKLQKVYINYN